MCESGRCRAMIRESHPYRDYALAVRQACNDAGVSVIYIGYYLRYGRELWSLAVQRFHAGDTLAAEVALRVEKWKRLGLSEALLHDIHSVVFNVPIPTP